MSNIHPVHKPKHKPRSAAVVYYQSRHCENVASAAYTGCMKETQRTDCYEEIYKTVLNDCRRNPEKYRHWATEYQHK